MIKRRGSWNRLGSSLMALFIMKLMRLMRIWADLSRPGLEDPYPGRLDGTVHVETLDDLEAEMDCKRFSKTDV
jgi:hypothetical protein